MLPVHIYRAGVINDNGCLYDRHFRTREDALKYTEHIHENVKDSEFNGCTFIEAIEISNIDAALKLPLTDKYQSHN